MGAQDRCHKGERSYIPNGRQVLPFSDGRKEDTAGTEPQRTRACLLSFVTHVIRSQIKIFVLITGFLGFLLKFQKSSTLAPDISEFQQNHKFFSPKL